MDRDCCYSCIGLRNLYYRPIVLVLIAILRRFAHLNLRVYVIGPSEFVNENDAVFFEKIP